jgi:hypothetical protein
MVERVQSQFPGLSAQALERAKTGLKSRLRSEKTRLAFDLKQFEGRDPDLPTLNLARWWSEGFNTGETERIDCNVVTGRPPGGFQPGARGLWNSIFFYNHAHDIWCGTCLNRG